MRPTVRVADDLNRVHPTDLAAYLASHGWQAEESGYRAGQLWVKPNVPRSPELLLPLDTELADYARRILELLSELERDEERPAADIVRDVFCAGADVVRLRRPSDAPSGSIPLRDGVSLVERAMEMMTAAACSAVAPRRVVPSKRPLQAQSYLQTVQLGQTERSSYVLTIISRVTPVADEPLSLFGDTNDPFPRQVTRTLVHALNAVSHALAVSARSGDISAFERGVESGVSANLCEAILGLVYPDDQPSEIRIYMDWSASRPNPHEPSVFHFDAAAAPLLSAAAKSLRAAEPLQGVLITGIVERLHRASDTRQGTVSVACVIEGANRQLAVPLEELDYQRAIDAHRHEMPVMFRADIERVGRRLQATAVSDFRVIS